MSKSEFRIIGPPGCGKTTYLARQVARSIEAGHKPLITSLTRAAAYEIGQKVEFSWEFGETQCGTLHAHCFRALGRPDLIESKEHVESWNKFAKEAGWQLSRGVFGTAKDGERECSAAGDGLFLSLGIHRARMDRDDLRPSEVKRFESRFNEWKRLEKLVDFTDLVELCARGSEHAPEDPDVIFVDEAQDHDRLELSLVRRWATHADMIIIGGDPDQNLYQFRGAEPEAFYATEIPPENTIVLKQSYRVPAAVRKVASKMIRRIEDRRDVEYLPTDEKGDVFKSALKLKDPARVVKRIEQLAKDGSSVMVLASCEYMIRGLIKSLRLAGLPFHNPYAPTRGQFNPISERRGVSSASRLLSLLRPQESVFGEQASMWTWGQFAAFVDPIKCDGFLRRGMKSRVIALGSEREDLIIDPPELAEVLHAETGAEELRKLDADPIAWFRDRLNASRLKSFEYPIQIAKRRGPLTLEGTPQIIIGTIHSVKGGEADHVLVFPDVSPQGADQLKRNPSTVIRQFYVGMTRARRSLSLCSSSGDAQIRW